jgi:hypothetical protein
MSMAGRPHPAAIDFSPDTPPARAGHRNLARCPRDAVARHAGIAVKLSPRSTNADFRIDGPQTHAGLVNLFGIESPG